MAEITLNKIYGIGWFLYDSEKKMVCIHRRDSKAPSRASMWDHFGGGFDKEKDQTELDTLSREVREELGFDITKYKVSEISRKNGQIMFVITFSIEDTSEIKLDEGAGFAWLKLEEALSLENLTPEAREGLELLSKK